MIRAVWLTLSIVFCCSMATFAQTPMSPEQSPEGLVQDCGQEAHWDPAIRRCRRNVPLKPLQGNILPPPPGVIVLHPGGRREQAATCPEGFEEKNVQGWRFCVDQKNPESIPLLMMPPVAGIPFETAQKIAERHADELQKLSGVETVIFGLDGIIVETDNPAVVPPNVEGVPVKTRPPRKRKFLNHSENSALNPLNGGVVTSDANARGSGTLTGVVLSHGKPWLVVPSHLFSQPINNTTNPPGRCSTDSICSPPPGQPPPLGASILNSCPHYATTQDSLYQPSWFASNRRRVGYAPRWTKNDGNVLSPTADVGAAFMDNKLQLRF